MLNLQQEKKLILNYFNDLDNAKNEELVDIIFKYTLVYVVYLEK